MRSKKPADYTKLCFVIAKVSLETGRLPGLKNLKSFVFKQQLTKRRLLGLDDELIRDAYLEIRKELFKIDKETPIKSELIYKEAEEAAAEVARMGRVELPKTDLNVNADFNLNVKLESEKKEGKIGSGKKKEGLI